LICSVWSLLGGISHDGRDREKGRDEEEREFHDGLEILLSKGGAVGLGYLYGRVKSRNMVRNVYGQNLGDDFESGVENSSVTRNYSLAVPDSNCVSTS